MLKKVVKKCLEAIFPQFLGLLGSARKRSTFSYRYHRRQDCLDPVVAVTKGALMAGGVEITY